MSNHLDPTQTHGDSHPPRPGKPSAHDLSMSMAKGRKLGPYEIVAELGRGGMGVVFKAYDAALHRDVALKLIPPNVANEEEKLARFLREARSAAKLQHPGIVPIYFAGEEDGVSFIAMGFVDGKTLGQIIEEDAPLPPAKAVTIIRDLADALQHAHGRGIIHRDIKPENLMIATDGTVRVMDFGLARSFTIEQGKITDTGIYLGTPVYSSPEQVKAAEMDGRSDIYSLGIVFYEMVTRQTPFHADSPYKIFHAIVNDDPTPPCDVNPLLPPPVAGVIEKMMAKDPADRYPTAAAVVEDCNKLLKVLDGSARLVISGDTVTLPRPSNRMPTAAQRFKKRVKIAALSALGIVAAAAIGYTAISAASKPVTPSLTPPANMGGPSAGTPPATNSLTPANPQPPHIAPVPRPRTLVLLRNFDNLNSVAKLDWLRNAIPVMLQRGLSDAEFLSLISPEEQERVSMNLGLRNVDDGNDFQRLVAELGADVVVRGSFLMVENQLHVAVQISDVHAGVNRGTVWINGEEREIFRMMADLATALKQKLDDIYNSPGVTGPEPGPIATADPLSSPVLQHAAQAGPDARNRNAQMLNDRMLEQTVDGRAVSEVVRAAKNNMYAQLPQEVWDNATSRPAVDPHNAGKHSTADLPDCDDPYDPALLEALQNELEQIEYGKSQIDGKRPFVDAPLGFDRLIRDAERRAAENTGLLDMSAVYREVARMWMNLQARGEMARVSGDTLRESNSPDAVQERRLSVALQYYSNAIDSLGRARAHREAGRTREMAIDLHQAMQFLINCLIVEPRFGPALDELDRLRTERWDVPNKPRE